MKRVLNLRRFFCWWKICFKRLGRWERSTGKNTTRQKRRCTQCRRFTRFIIKSPAGKEAKCQAKASRTRSKSQLKRSSWVRIMIWEGKWVNWKNNWSTLRLRMRHWTMCLESLRTLSRSWGSSTILIKMESAGMIFNRMAIIRVYTNSRGFRAERCKKEGRLKIYCTTRGMKRASVTGWKRGWALIQEFWRAGVRWREWRGFNFTAQLGRTRCTTQ